MEGAQMPLRIVRPLPARRTEQAAVLQDSIRELQAAPIPETSAEAAPSCEKIRLGPNVKRSNCGAQRMPVRTSPPSEAELIELEHGIDKLATESQISLTVEELKDALDHVENVISDLRELLGARKLSPIPKDLMRRLIDFARENR
jgi:hypothetical protein